MVLTNICLARQARSRVSTLALCLGFAWALGTATPGPAFAQAPATPASEAAAGKPAAGKPAASAAASNSAAKRGGGAPPAKSAAASEADEDDTEEKEDKDDKARGRSPEERLARRRERLEQGAKRLRERAADLRKRIAAGETAPPQPPNSKRPPRSLEDQAERFEKQAARMEERAKNLTVDSVGGSQRSPEYARQRRHQLRRSHLNRRWGGATLRDPEAMAELKMHAERVARLKRIRSLAMEKGKDDPLAKRAKELLNKEDDRHEERMKAIQARVAPAAATAAAPTDTTAPAATEATK